MAEQVPVLPTRNGEHPDRVRAPDRAFAVPPRPAVTPMSGRGGEGGIEARLAGSGHRHLRARRRPGKAIEPEALSRLGTDPDHRLGSGLLPSAGLNYGEPAALTGLRPMDRTFIEEFRKTMPKAKRLRLLGTDLDAVTIVPRAQDRGPKEGCSTVRSEPKIVHIECLRPGVGGSAGDCLHRHRRGYRDATLPIRGREPQHRPRLPQRAQANGSELFRSMLKRGQIRVYQHMCVKHLGRHVVAFVPHRDVRDTAQRTR